MRKSQITGYDLKVTDCGKALALLYFRWYVISKFWKG